MDLDIRPVTDDEYAHFVRRIENSFGQHAIDERIEHWRQGAQLDRSLAAFDAGEIVGTTDSGLFDLTLPGLGTIPAAGVTAVGVLSTHRRRGILTRLMARQLDDAVARDEPVAILTASEAPIYGRFGYGWATSQAAAVIQREHTAFAHPVEDQGRVRFVEAAEAAKLLPVAHDRARRLRPGEINRPPDWWRNRLAYFFAVHESGPGREVDGYVSYRTSDRSNFGLPGVQVFVVDLMGVSAEVEAVLWRFVFDIDLTGEIRAAKLPVDDPIRWRLADPRRLRVESVVDDIWVRLLDLPRALSARAYGADGEVVFEVSDPFRPANDGRYLVSAGAGCTRTDRDADVAVGVDDLGSTYLGGVRFSTLAAAGRVRELRPGALARADALFGPVGAEPAPFCHTGF
jgi:predicted acetyltransferase